MRLVALRDTMLAEVVPALPTDPIAQLCEPHRVISVDQRLCGFAPALPEKLQYRQQPGKPEQEREVRLARRHAPVSANSVAFRLMAAGCAPFGAAVSPKLTKSCQVLARGAPRRAGFAYECRDRP